MRNIYKKLISYERGRKILLFLFCLFLAFIIWSVHKLSGNYSHFFQYKIVVKSSLPGRSGESASEQMISIRGRASGFYILQQRYGRKSKTLHISPESRFFRRNPGDNDKFYILSNDVRAMIIESLGDKVILEYINSDTINLEIPKNINQQ
ncbi:MAG: hypothetical protein A2X19_05690 [Bacteroidetes bacterium GWE2_39_28]|nr:MAG: hypothetical protein A2X19_05690 [Bacteroidetes bacterium GWE2_39_28]OFY15163.1 MAG: hypothetical protein A2X16_08410 [Bacteroidetes bacterium GWF2_39_10]OFZ10970.1 MAG: hypothetical protein A2465_00500 [Bacteroidetes bacterium RIFOXYC2_FULL_39_11]HCT93786.1 hypothetical protein [Rikenellaceae bacterium]